MGTFESHLKAKQLVNQALRESMFGDDSLLKSIKRGLHPVKKQVRSKKGNIYEQTFWENDNSILKWENLLNSLNGKFIEHSRGKIRRVSISTAESLKKIDKINSNPKNLGKEIIRFIPNNIEGKKLLPIQYFVPINGKLEEYEHWRRDKSIDYLMFYHLDGETKRILKWNADVDCWQEQYIVGDKKIFCNVEKENLPFSKNRNNIDIRPYEVFLKSPEILESSNNISTRQEIEEASHMDDTLKYRNKYVEELFPKEVSKLNKEYNNNIEYWGKGPALKRFNFSYAELFDRLSEFTNVRI